MKVATVCESSLPVSMIFRPWLAVLQRPDATTPLQKKGNHLSRLCFFLFWRKNQLDFDQKCFESNDPAQQSQKVLQSEDPTQPQLQPKSVKSSKIQAKRQRGMISVCSRKDMTSGSSTFTRAPITPRDVSLRNSMGRSELAAFRKG